MSEEIAIIGMAGRFPGANDIREFHRNLRSARDCVVEISRQRFCDTTFPLGNEPYQVMGLLDQIDRFDRRFFNVSPREAQQMDPHQRITLELAYETLEDSGYSPASFAGSRTAVIVANADYTYLKNFEVLEPTMYSGNSQFSVAGRVARFFNMKGPAFVIDTGCSSGLMAVTLACDQLNLGKCATALVAGVRIVLEPLPVNLDVDVGITSFDGKTRSFNADSNGSGSSEAAVAVLLKPLRQALADNDHIHAVIKASAVNSSAQSSASLTATSSAAQSEMLVEAWQRAGIDPATIDYIEAHGSGTQLGDPIEIGGLDLAFRQFTQRKHACAVSSVKSNIGHTDKVAGLAGLAKAVLSLRHAEHFASLHFTRPNPLIDFENSAVHINTALKPWLRANGTPRRAGVNSFGFAGNNVHAVLEEAPPRPDSGAASGSSHCIVALSSKRADGLVENRTALLRHLEENAGLPLADVGFTLNTGREHFRYREAFVAQDIPALVAQLRQAAPPDSENVAPPPQIEPVFLFSGDTPLDPSLVLRLAAACPEFARHHAECTSLAESSAAAEPVRRFAFQYALYRLLETLGAGTANVVGLGVGELVASVIVGDMSLGEALRRCTGPNDSDTANLPARLAALIEQSTESVPALFVEMGTDGTLLRGLRELNTPAQRELYDVLALDAQAADGVLELVRRLYVAGGAIDWSALHRHYRGRRISLPGYQFEKTRCWHRPAHTIEAYEEWRQRVSGGTQSASPRPDSPADRAHSAPSLPAAKFSVDSRWSPTEQEVARIWLEVLKIDRVGLDDDFFALGGHSLFGTMVRNRVEKAFQLRLEFRDIFAHSKIRSLAASIDRLLARGARIVVEKNIPRLAPASHYPASPAQRLIWRLEQQEGSMNAAYNVPVVFRLTGPLDLVRLEHALREIVSRHEILRTHFVEIDGEPRQIISPAEGFAVERLSLSDGETATNVVDRFIRPFDLARPPLVRAALLGEAPDSHVLVLDIHHTLFDGSSLGVLLAELAQLYRGAALPPLPCSYKDYAAWRLASLADSSMREAEAFWLAEYAGVVPTLDLPVDFSRSAARRFEGALVQVEFDSELSARIRALAQGEGATLFIVLLAGYSVLLSKLSGQDDFVIGSSVAGRTHADLEPLLGMFVNTLPFRTHPRANLTFRDFLSEVREHCLQVYKHQAYPLDTLLRQRSLPRRPLRGALFDTLLVLQNMDLGLPTLDEGVGISPVEFTRKSAKYDLTFEFYDTPAGLALNVEYATGLFRPATIRAMIEGLKQVLAAGCSNPGAILSELASNQERESNGNESPAEDAPALPPAGV